MYSSYLEVLLVSTYNLASFHILFCDVMWALSVWIVLQMHQLWHVMVSCSLYFHNLWTFFCLQWKVSLLKDRRYMYLLMSYVYLLVKDTFVKDTANFVFYASGSSKLPVTSMASLDRGGLLRLVNNIRHKFSLIECVLSLIR